MNRSAVLLALVFSVMLLTGCGDKSANTNSFPSINSVSPTMGPPGTTVTIKGTGFSETVSSNKVTFDGMLGEVVSASETNIEAMVPQDANSGAVAVIVDGQTAIGPNFTVEEEMPGIISVEPDSGTVGTEVTINGMNFSSAASENTITFNGGVIAEVQQVSNTELKTEVPVGAKSGPIQVEVDGQKTLSPAFKIINEGTLQVIVTTTGPDQDSDGYTFSVDKKINRTVATTETIFFPELDEGNHSLKITGLAANCSLGGSKTRMIDITAADTTSVSFDITCSDVLKDQIVFSSNMDGNKSLYLMDSDGSNLIRLTDDQTEDSSPDISPHGSHIVFQGKPYLQSHIYVINADGTNRLRLSTNSGVGLYPRFSPDGSKITFTQFDGNDHEIFVINKDGTNLKRLTDNSADDSNPAFSPDGSHIVYMGNDGSDNQLFLVNTDGTGFPVQLTNTAGSEYDPVISPDGSKVVFQGWDGTDDELYSIGINGSNRTKLTDNDIPDSQPVFSKDGTKIAFVRTVGGDYDIYVMNADGTGEVAITNNATTDTQPSFSPDGTMIIFWGSDGSDNEIFIAPTDGSSPPVNLTANSSASDTSPDWSPIE